MEMKNILIILMLLLLTPWGASVAFGGYQNWNDGEPNNVGTGGEQCSEMYSDGAWNDDDCTGEFYPGLCEVNGHYETTSPMGWNDARDECLSRGGHLAIIQTAAENSYIASNYGHVHIGYSDKGIEDQWTWGRGGATDWDEDEPNDAGGENCAETWQSEDVNDEDCNEYDDAICQFRDDSLEKITNIDTWSEARSVCYNKGGWLASPLDNPNIEPDQIQGADAYLGHHDKKAEGEWIPVNRPPFKPDKLSPSDGTTISNTQTVSLSARYRDPEVLDGTLRFYNAENNNLIDSCNIRSNTQCSVSLSVSDGSYSWYVESDDGYLTRQSSKNSFTVDNNNPPQINNPIDPADGEQGVGLNPSLKLDVNDPDGDNMDVTFYKDGVGSNPIGTVSATSISDAVLDSSNHGLGGDTGASYSWSARVKDGNGGVVDTSTYSFNIIEKPQIGFISPNAGDNKVSLSPTIRFEVSQAQNKDLNVEYSLNGGGESLSGAQIVAGTTSTPKTVSDTFNLDANTAYTLTVNSSFKDEFANNIKSQDSIQFTTDSKPSLNSFEPLDNTNGHYNPRINLSFNNGGDPVTARLYNWETGNKLAEKTGITNGKTSFNTANYQGFGGNAGDTEFWYTELVSEPSNAAYNTSKGTNDPYQFEVLDIQNVDFTVLQGNNNLNPGVKYGPTDIKLKVTTNTGASIDRIRFKIDGSDFINKTDMSSGEVLSLDITNATSKGNTYTWSATASDQGVQIGGAGDQFTTYVLEAQIKEPNTNIADLDYNLYHANSNASFDFGNGAYDKVLTTSNTTVKMALNDFGTGSDDCFKATSQNLEGESLEAYPLLGEDGQCAGNLAP